MSEDFDDVLRKFRREMLGGMVAHMGDDQVEAWLKPFAVDVAVEEGHAGPPRWWVQSRDEARASLLRVLDERLGQVEAMQMQRDWAEAKARGEV